VEKQAEKFRFECLQGIITKVLKEERPIILKGKFTAELVDSLASLFVNSPPTGKLIILTEESTLFPFQTAGIGTFSTHKNPTFEEKKEALSAEELMILGKFEAQLPKVNPPFVHLKTMCAYKKAHPLQSIKDCWKGIKHIDEEKTSLLPVNLDNYEQISIDFINSRLTALRDSLNHAPYVFVVGETGVTKVSSP
jgi:hypothetical protein